jgi:hypothetical protein
MQMVQPLTIGKSLNSLNMNLWNEQQQELVSFRSLLVEGFGILHLRAVSEVHS